ncbi:MAG: type II toxin-antitoxin system PemK/MazF family toxin [Clostridia bacterium]|nr:type II toxin-antitoxin system PemK/MazF family toxin [Clostridia bacterium]
MNKKIIRRWEIYYADLNPTVGSEQSGIRPVLILQNNIGNRYSPTVIVAPITGQTGKPPIPTHIPLPMPILEKNSLLLMEQIRTIDKSRLRERIGKIPAEYKKRIIDAAEISIGFACRKE